MPLDMINLVLPKGSSTLQQRVLSSPMNVVTIRVSFFSESSRGLTSLLVLRQPLPAKGRASVTAKNCL